jgi:threonine synthase
LAGDNDGLPDIEKNFETLAVSIGATQSTYQALNALRQSGGLAVPVGNSGLIAFQEQLALAEGIFAELASVTPFAAIESLRKKNVMTPKDRVVAIVTASGLKDIDRSAPGDSQHQVFDSVDQAWSDLSVGSRLPSRSDPVLPHAQNI